MKTITQRFLILLLLVWLVPVRGSHGSWEKPAGYCQILDHVHDPVYRVVMGVIPKSRFEGHGQSTFWEVDADWEMAYWRDIFAGDIDVNLRMRNTISVGSAEIDFPGQLSELALDVGWAWRFGDGMAFQLRAMPGLYCDLEDVSGRSMFVPFSGALIRAFSSRLSGLVGAEIRPGFDRVLTPLVGLEWEISRPLRLEAKVPQSRVVWFVNPDWTTALGLDWRNTSYALDEERKTVTLEDFRATWMLMHRLSDRFEVSGEVGHAFGRTVDFRRDDEGKIDIEDMTFARAGVGGAF